MNSSTIWYLEPVSPKVRATNEALSKLLPEENACGPMKCAGGKQHNLWRCEGVEMARAFMGDPRFSVVIWRQEESSDITEVSPDEIESRPPVPKPNPRIEEIRRRLQTHDSTIR